MRLHPELGGGALWDVGCYAVSYAQLIAGADAVSVAGQQQLGPTGVDEQFAGSIEYANGVQAQVFASFRAVYQTFVRIIGTAGTIEIERPFRPEPIDYVRMTRERRLDVIDVSGNAFFVDEVRDMEDAALGAKTPTISLIESRALASTLAALLASARSGRHTAVHARQ